MSRYVDLDEIVDAMYYDEEREEWHLKKETIESALGHVDSYTVREWIPVSEGLPIDCILVLVTYLDEDVNFPIVDIAFYRDKQFHNKDFERLNVLAWMELPKPYEEKE